MPISAEVASLALYPPQYSLLRLKYSLTSDATMNSIDFPVFHRSRLLVALMSIRGASTMAGFSFAILRRIAKAAGTPQ